MSARIVRRAQAIEILKHPVFRNSDCIEAVAWLEAFEQLGNIREQLHVNKFECPCCHGTGETLCRECHNFHECHTCGGVGSWKTLTEYEQAVYLHRMETGTLHELRDRIKEFQELLK